VEFIPEEPLEVVEETGECRNGVMTGIVILKVGQGTETMIRNGKMIDLMTEIENHMRGETIVMIVMFIEDPVMAVEAIHVEIQGADAIASEHLEEKDVETVEYLKEEAEVATDSRPIAQTKTTVQAAV